MKRQKGITLIGLVITIIVLVILAGVSIVMTIGENGVLSQSAKAKEDTAIAEEKEMIGLAYSTLNTDVMTGEKAKITATDLQNELNKMYGEEKVTVAGLNVLTVKYTTSQREYILDTNGKFLESLPIEEVLASATRHPNQTLTEDIGIAEDGSQVNLDLWKYTLKSDNTYRIGGDYASGYDNNNIVDGKIQGKVPRYIKEENGEFYEVSYICFWECTNLVVAPDLPDSITSLEMAFNGCENLERIDRFPSNLISLRHAFFGCTNLKEVAEIPNTVTEMGYAFRSCTSLSNAPEIPSTVEGMSCAFLYCANLTGTLKINNNISKAHYYESFLKEAATADGCNLVLVGNGENDDFIQKIYSAVSSNTNITVQ